MEPADLDARLFDACAEERTDEVLALLNLGADLLSADPESGRTAFEQLVPTSDTKLVGRLLEMELDWDTPVVATGTSAFAMQAGYLDKAWEGQTLLRALLATGPDLNAQDNRGQTVLHEVFEAPLIRILLEAGAHPDVRDQQGRTPLHQCAWSDLWRQVQLYIDAGADPQLPDTEGSTPLLSATRRMNTRVVTVLIAAGTDPTLANDAGETARSLGVASGDPALMFALGIGSDDPQARARRAEAERIRGLVVERLRGGACWKASNREYWETLRFEEGVFLYESGDLMAGGAVEHRSTYRVAEEAVEFLLEQESWRDEGEVERLEHVLERLW